MSTNKVFGDDAKRLKDKHVVIIGIGGTGCTVANLLSRLGIRLTIVDHDIVDDKNLERQILFDWADILRPKTNAARNKLSQFTKVIAHNEELTERNIDRMILGDTDLVMDCTDNVKTRLLLNDYCRKKKIDWIYTGAVGSIGAIYFVGGKHDGPCFRCFNAEKEGETSCEIGVLNTLVTMVASVAVNVALNYLVKGTIEKDMIRINMKDNSMIRIKIKKNAKCLSCS